MVRRNYKIKPEQDELIAQLSRDGEIDKEQVVQAALDLGLPEVRNRWERAGKPKGLEFFRAILIGADDESIREPRATRRRSR